MHMIACVIKTGESVHHYWMMEMTVEFEIVKAFVD